MKPAANQEVLACFWRLADLAHNKRLQATLRLVNECQGKSDSLEYSLERLVAGLASSRLASRLGFSVALGRFMEEGLINVSQVIDVVDKKLPLSQDEKGNAIGQTLAFSVLLECNSTEKLDKSLANDLVLRLVNIGESFPHLQTMTDEAIITYASKSDVSVLEKIIWKHYSELCNVETDKLTLRGLWVCLAVRSRAPRLLSNGDSLFSSSNYPTHVRLLATSTGWHTVHPCVKVWVCEAVKEDNFDDLWQNVVVQGLARHAAEKVRHLAITMVGMAIQYPHKILGVCPASLFETIVKCCTNKASSEQLKKGWRDFLLLFKQCIEDKKVGDSCAVKLVSTISRASLIFDRVTKVAVTDALLGQLPQDGVQDYVTSRLEVVRDSQDWMGAVKQVTRLIPTLTDHKHILVAVNTIKEALLATNNNEEKADSLRCALYSIFDSMLLTRRRDNSSQVLISKDHLSVMQQFVKKSVKKSYEDLRKIVKTVLKKLDTMMDVEQLQGPNMAFTILLTYFSVWLVLANTPKDTKLFTQTLQELLECVGRMEGSVQVEGGPHWLDVVIDLSISLLSNPNRHIAHVLPRTIHFLAPVINFNSLQPILKALSVEEVDTLVEEDDTDTENEDSVSDCEDMDSCEEKDTWSHSEDQSGEEETSDEGEHNESDIGDDEDVDESDPHLIGAVSDALGEARAHTDVDESDFSDDTMLKLDAMISNAFKSHLGRRTTKDNKLMVVHQARDYRLRLFNLLQWYIESTQSADVIVNLLPRVLSIGNEAVRSKEHQMMYKRAVEAVTTMFSLKLAWNTTSVTVVAEAYAEVYAVAARLTNPIFQSLAGDVAAFILRKCGEPNELVPKFLVELDSFMTERQCHLPDQLFQVQFNKHPSLLFGGVFDSLLGYAFHNESVRPVRKSEAMMWVRALLKKDVLQGVKYDRHIEKLVNALKKVAGNVKETDSPRFVAECLITLLHASKIDIIREKVVEDETVVQVVNELRNNVEKSEVKAVNGALLRIGSSLNAIANQLTKPIKPVRNKRKSKGGDDLLKKQAKFDVGYS